MGGRQSRKKLEATAIRWHTAGEAVCMQSNGQKRERELGQMVKTGKLTSLDRRRLSQGTNSHMKRGYDTGCAMGL